MGGGDRFGQTILGNAVLAELILEFRRTCLDKTLQLHAAHLHRKHLAQLLSGFCGCLELGDGLVVISAFLQEMPEYNPGVHFRDFCQ